MIFLIIYRLNRLANGLEQIVQKTNTLETTFYKQFNNFHIKSTHVTDPSQLDVAYLGFKMIRSSNKKGAKKSKLDQIDTFLNDTQLRFGGFYNSDALRSLLSSGKTPKLTYIGYVTSKLFTANSTANTEVSELNCSNTRQISSSVLSISRVPGVKPVDNLVTNVFEQQDVI